MDADGRATFSTACALLVVALACGDDGVMGGDADASPSPVEDAAGADDGGIAAGAGTGASGGGASATSDAGTADAGDGVAGAGASGTGASGAGASGAGASGIGASGTGASGTGASGTGASGTGASGTGASGTGASGAGGTGSTIECSIAVNAMLSGAIATVGIVNWSTDLSGIDSARIEFGLVETGPTMVAPVDLSAPAYRTLLLGMKQGRQYVYRIVASTGDETCTSDEHMLTTGMLGEAPAVVRESMLPGAASTGFIVTSNRSAGTSGGSAMIFDTDGDVVWLAAAPPSTSRARMSYEGTDMWMLELNVRNAGGEMRRVSMDGLDVENDASGLADAHHDFTVLPGGVVAATIWIGSGPDADNALIERAPDGTVTTVVDNVASLYAASGYHCNSIHYHPSDDTYTIGDRNPNAFVKITRQGQLLWQFGGTDPIGAHFPAAWSVNHGHHVLSNGNVLFYNNGNTGSSTVREYALNAATSTATLVWDYATGLRSPTLGDAQRLPNGNTLVTNSNGGLIEEVDAAGNLVQTFMVGGIGYADFRTSLYGPPPR